MRNIEIASLTDQTQANSNSGLERLYVENYDRVEKFVRYNHGSMEQAKDLYQDAFLAMWQQMNSGKFKPLIVAEINKYLFRIAKNKWMDHLRSKNFKKTIYLSEDFSDEARHETFDEKEKKLSADIQKVLTAFGEMGQPCKSVLAQFYFDKKKLAEIALALNINEHSARNKKYRCLQKLRRMVFEKEEKK